MFLIHDQNHDCFVDKVDVDLDYYFLLIYQLVPDCCCPLFLCLSQMADLVKNCCEIQGISEVHYEQGAGLVADTGWKVDSLSLDNNRCSAAAAAAADWVEEITVEVGCCPYLTAAVVYKGSSSA
jgi:hypothetical protein